MSTTNNGILIVFFSHRGENYFDGKIRKIEEGNTEIVAKIVQSSCSGVIYELIPVNPYPETYNETVKRSIEEKKTNFHPAFRRPLLTIDNYQHIFIGFPCWCGTYPQIVASFLSYYDFSNKNVYPFITHEGSQFGRSIIDLELAIPTAKIHQGLAIKGTDVLKSTNKIKNWVHSSLNLDNK